MKIRTDFVSNSSSSSFIVNEHNKSIFEQCFPGRKLINLNDIIVKLINMYKFITEQYESLERIVGDKYGSGKMFHDIFYDIDSLRDTLTETLNMLKEINVNPELDSAYITEPVDRDRAYMLNFHAPLFEGDL
jgi:hypothetical protein